MRITAQQLQETIEALVQLKRSLPQSYGHGMLDAVQRAINLLLSLEFDTEK
jgi:hypothetical protein